MSRRSRATAARVAQARAGQTAAATPRSASPFATLAALQRERKATQPGGPAPDGKAGASGARQISPQDIKQRPSDSITADDLALFRKANPGTRPLRPDGRSQLERPRPEPVPRPKAAADEEPADARGRLPIDPLQAAYEDVTPLRGNGRVELDTQARHRIRNQDRADQGQFAVMLPDPAALPSDVDPNDAAALFRHAMRGAIPVDTRNRVELERAAPAPAPVKREADERAALNESLAAPLSFEDRLDMGDEAAFLRTGLPRRVLSDLRRGRWVLQGQIDLHGLTRDEARDALGQFLSSCLQQGRRCIRVIHGKGLGSPGRVSILKQLSRGWLAQREEILAFCQAGPHDGGSGALLVLIRAQNAPRD